MLSLLERQTSHICCSISGWSPCMMSPRASQTHGAASEHAGVGGEHLERELLAFNGFFKFIVVLSHRRLLHNLCLIIEGVDILGFPKPTTYSRFWWSHAPSLRYSRPLDLLSIFWAAQRERDINSTVMQTCTKCEMIMIDEFQMILYIRSCSRRSA